MPAFRIGFGSDFTLVNQLVGIGSTASRTKLEVDGGALKGDFNISGVSSLTQYAGFVPQIQNISVASTIGFTTTGIGSITGISTAAAVGVSSFVTVNERETGFVSLIGQYNSLSQDIVVDDGRIFDINTPQNIGVTTIGTQNVYTPGISTVTVGTLPNVSIGTHFSVPNGGIAARTDSPTEGMVRFNDDLNTLEFWNGFEWRQFTVSGASGRGVFAGQSGPSSSAIIDYVNISSTGNAISFGTLQNVNGGGGCSSNIRGIHHRAGRNTIDYITIASEGNGINFGSGTQSTCSTSASNSTRGLFVGGYASGITPSGNSSITYIQISTLGNVSSFGNLTRNIIGGGSCASPTRWILAGGAGPAYTSQVDAVTIASTGNAVSFGNLTRQAYALFSCSSSTRGIFAGGGDGQASINSNRIDYVTIASFGNASTFGELTAGRVPYANGTSNNIRGVFAGGYRSSPLSHLNTIDYITIATTGNATYFGDSTVTGWGHTGLSDSHGGLGGF